MGWRKMVNRTLERTTGYELRRPLPPPPPPPPRGRSLPADYDDEARDVIHSVRPFTMTSPERLNALILATRYVSRHRVPGAVVECGVWRGGSMQAVAHTLLSAGDTSRDLYLFDTFEGMPPPTEKDRRRDGESAADLLARRSKDAPIWAIATLDDVREGFAQVPYPQERLHFVPGRVEDTIPDGAPEEISILRLDTDWYASTRHELEYLYPRLVSGGVLLIDDYGWWQGSREAVDEFLEKTGARLLLLRMDEGRIAVKP
ncbi:TylF/MycF/NovP-related O-methyltransferase [Streptomyces sp. 8N706]|uniref:TylF/MycF/NovP-related O-methyltransferase n=1 Tax=Streptomyces sp. 8N706 TaxID=3457416 RepID=UPI003FD6075B